MQPSHAMSGTGQRPRWCLCCCVTLCILLALTIFYAIFSPEEPTFSITDAALTQFSFNITSTMLTYNLPVLEITMRNPNIEVGIDYRRIMVTVIYQNAKFGGELVTTTPFYEECQSNLRIQVPHARYDQPVDFKERDIAKYNSETADGVYSIDLQLNLRFRIRSKLLTSYYSPEIHCKLRVPLLTTYKQISENSFGTTMCSKVSII